MTFFEELWAVGSSDPERFFAMLAERTTPDALFTQPLAPPARGPAGQRASSSARCSRPCRTWAWT